MMFQGGEKRRGYAYKKLHEFIIALSGSFDVVLDNGEVKRVYSLNRSYLASEEYNEDDYMRDYSKFKLNIQNE